MNDNSKNPLIDAVSQLEERHSQVSQRVADLQRSVLEWKDGEVQNLRKVLTVAKDKLKEQDDLLQRLTTEPLPYAVVVSVTGTATAQGPRAFTIGARVRIRRDSEYSHQNSGEGVIIEDVPEHKAWRRVRFDDGYKNNYRIGMTDSDDHQTRNGECDLELVFSTAVVVLYEGKQLEVLPPEHKQVNPGDTVKLSMKTMQIVDVAEPVATGDTSLVRSVRNDKFVEIDHGGSIRVASAGKLSGKLEEGDRILLDSTLSVVLVNLGKEDRRFSFNQTTNITWDDVGGLAEAKKQMIEAIEMPFRHKNVYAKYGKKPIKGILLYGPPGCGKTLLAKAAATALAKLHKSNGADTGFIYVKGPEILDRYVGVAEATIRQIFMQARKHKEEHGFPAVIFIDEADAILGKRGSGISSDMERTIVPMFLAEMDGLEDSGAVMLLSTNRPDVLDSAIVRDGRIDRKVKVDRPDKDSAVEVFKLHLRGVPFNNGYTVQDMAVLGRDQLFSDRNRLYDIHVSTDKDKKVIPFTLGHLINGAMIAGIVDQATSLAIHRDISKGGDPKGLTKDDVIGAIDCTYEQNRDLNHQDELAEFVRDFRKDVVQIKRSDFVKQGGGLQGIVTAVKEAIWKPN